MGLGFGFVVANFLVIAKEVIPLVIALVLATEAAVAPAIVFDPFPSEFAAGSGGGGGGVSGGGETKAAFVVEAFGGDEDEGFLEGPVAFPVFSGDWDGDGGGGVVLVVVEVEGLLLLVVEEWGGGRIRHSNDK